MNDGDGPLREASSDRSEGEEGKEEEDEDPM